VALYFVEILSENGAFPKKRIKAAIIILDIQIMITLLYWLLFLAIYDNFMIVDRKKYWAKLLSDEWIGVKRFLSYFNHLQTFLVPVATTQVVAYFAADPG